MIDLESKVKAHLVSAQSSVKKEDVGTVLSQIDRILEILRKSEILRSEIAKVKLLLRMLKDYWDGVYTEVPWHTIAAIVVALLYLLSPVDIIPDFIPVIGYADDLLMLIIMWKLVCEDVRVYAEWKYRTTKDEEVKSLYKEAFGEELVVGEDVGKSEARA